MLNLQRAVQAAIDLGAHTLASYGYEMPATLREIFAALERQGLLSSSSAQSMQKMCGFRNIAVLTIANCRLMCSRRSWCII